MDTGQTDSVIRLSEKQKKYMLAKRVMDIIFSGAAAIMLGPAMILISIAIKLESPGPVLFKQKRVGINKGLFEIWKFRTMKMDSPRDVPTHMLPDPEQYITKCGRLLRKSSLDELPQIFNIFRGEMSIVGPRPALWNQSDLIALRDKYGANSVMPGLTGWAQINGRDELEIEAKARFDGEYAEKMGFVMDIRCLLGTIGPVLSFAGVAEGGTGGMHKKGREESSGGRLDKTKKEIQMGMVLAGMFCTIGAGVAGFIAGRFAMKKNSSGIAKKKSRGFFNKLAVFAAAAEAGSVIYINIKRRVQLKDNFTGNTSGDAGSKTDSALSTPRHILITGAGSYIGMSMAAWLSREGGRYTADTLDMRGSTWREHDFSPYDAVYHVAGIAHADAGPVTKEQEQLYYKVNTDLAVETAEKAKEAGVKQFIFMSSMIVYSGCKEKMITSSVMPKPLNFYGDSKWQAERRIQGLSSEFFKVVILRPPMVYGKGSRGNYPELARLASTLPAFPIVSNKRSMLYIDNLCQFVKLMIDNEESGVFFPQNGEYANTSDLVQMIAGVKGHPILMVPWTNSAVRLMGKMPCRAGRLANKAFGDFAYDMGMSEYKENYRVRTMKESVRLAEGTE